MAAGLSRVPHRALPVALLRPAHRPRSPVLRDAHPATGSADGCQPWTRKRYRLGELAVREELAAQTAPGHWHLQSAVPSSLGPSRSYQSALDCCLLSAFASTSGFGLTGIPSLVVWQVSLPASSRRGWDVIGRHPQRV